MKTKLYKKFIKLVCKDFSISRKQLFSRDFPEEYVITYYNYDLDSKTLKKDHTQIMLLSRKYPLSQIYDALDFHTRWLLKYWKHSHWKSFIQTNLDLGVSLDDVLKMILKKS